MQRFVWNLKMGVHRVWARMIWLNVNDSVGSIRSLDGWIRVVWLVYVWIGFESPLFARWFEGSPQFRLFFVSFFLELILDERLSVRYSVIGWKCMLNELCVENVANPKLPHFSTLYKQNRKISLNECFIAFEEEFLEVFSNASAKMTCQNVEINSWPVEISEMYLTIIFCRWKIFPSMYKW